MVTNEGEDKLLIETSSRPREEWVPQSKTHYMSNAPHNNNKKKMVTGPVRELLGNSAALKLLVQPVKPNLMKIDFPVIEPWYQMFEYQNRLRSNIV